MIGCPDGERFTMLLDERLDELEQALIVGHVEGCPHCQDHLEALTAERSRAWDALACGGTDHPTLVHRPPWRASAASAPESGPGGFGWPTVARLRDPGGAGPGGDGGRLPGPPAGPEPPGRAEDDPRRQPRRPEHLARFRIEAEAVARLRHPNVVQIYDVGEADGLPFVALELLEGGSLDDAARPARRSRAGRPAELLATLAGAVARGPRAGIVHRDLKPANVLFDLRRHAQGRRLRPGQAARRRTTARPETRPGHGLAQLHGPRAGRGAGAARSARRPTSTRWARSSTRCSPAGRRSRGRPRWRPLHQVVHDEPVPPSRLQPGVPRDLETICLKCLDKEPHRALRRGRRAGRRPRRFLDGEPILARRTGPGSGLEVGPAPAAPPPCWPLGARPGRLGVARRVRVRAARESAARRRRTSAARASWPPDRACDGAREAAGPGRPGSAAASTADRLDARSSDEPRLADLPRRGQVLLERLRPRPRRAGGAARPPPPARPVRSGSRDEALLRDTQFTGLDQFGDAAATRRPARAALDGSPARRPDGDLGAGPLPASLSAAERAEVAARPLRAAPDPGRGAGPAAPRRGPRARPSGPWRILDEGPRCTAPPTGPTTCAGPPAWTGWATPARAARERRRPSRSRPPTPSATSCWARSSTAGGDLAGPIAEFEEAAPGQPDQFRAQLLLGRLPAEPRPPRPDVARAELTACLQREPGRSPALPAPRARLRRGGLRRRAARERPAARRGRGRGLADAEADFRTALSARAWRRPPLRPAGQPRRRPDPGQAGRRRRRRLPQAVALDPAGTTPTSPRHRRPRQGRPEEALAQLDRAIALQPDLPPSTAARALGGSTRAATRRGPGATSTRRSGSSRPAAPRPPPTRRAAAACSTSPGAYGEALDACDAALGDRPRPGRGPPLAGRRRCWS